MEKEKWKLVTPDLKKLETTKRKIVFSGVTNSTAKTYITLLLRTPLLDGRRVIFWCLKNEKEKEELIANIKFWLGYLKINTPLYNLENNNSQIISFLLHEKNLLVMGTPEEMLKEIPSPYIFKENILNLKIGQVLNLAKLSYELIKRGYEIQQFASKAGFFARKGGIIDIFPLDFKNPLKIEFSGNEIVSINLIDLKDKKSLKNLQKVKIIPAKLDFLTQTSTIFDYLNKDAIFIYSDREIFFEIFPYWQEIEEKTKNYKKIIFESLKTDKSEVLDFKESKRFRQDFKNFINYLKDCQNKKYNILILSQREKALLNLFKEHNLIKAPKIINLPDEQIRGFISLLNKIVFLTDWEIFGEVRKEEIKRRKRINLELIYQLKEGDFVVHLDHGIARFKGIVKQRIDYTEKEYFSLEYAEKDKLFVPIEYAEKISKYIGEAQPKLHRLSGTTWLQLTRKIKESAEQKAHELIKFYAKRETSKAFPLKKLIVEEKELASSFPFNETEDQKKAIEEVLVDLEDSKPMDRLICGDVGFGKTEVAIRAAFRAVLNHKQVALLSPTTILTQQHYDTFKNRLKAFPLEIAILSRVDSPKKQKETIDKVKNGLIDIVIGTHRLLSSDVQFKDLGLIIIDEEQRFGVKDKEKLKAMRDQAHVLTLTATPIPRTLNFSLSGLRDISVIKTAPQERKAVETIITPYFEEEIKKAILEELKRKGQVYYLHNRVETINLKANHLKKLVPQAKIGIVHGRLKEKVLMEEMRKFDNQETNLLVCSTIIENGLDLPNVNTLIVENATRFGLADLYQLRGRIGRSFKKAFAYFLYHSKKLKETARKRLKALLEARELGSGFELALRDLEIRGSGNILGYKQSGHIKAIGLNLYLRLLNQAIEEIKTGEKMKPVRDIQIDLPLNLGIPKEIIPEEGGRLKVYQELANILQLDELNEYKDKFIKKYKKLPEILKNLFGVLKLKILAQKTNILSINAAKISLEGIEKEKIVINFIDKIRPEQIEKLLKINPAWDFTDEQIKIEKSKLGENWLPKLIECVKVFK